MAYLRVIELTVILPDTTRIEIKNFRITCDLNKTLNANPNTGTVKIYNLNKDTRKRIEQVDAEVIVKAGYEDEKGAIPIFYGAIQRAVTERNGLDNLTTLYITDSAKEARENNISLSFGEGTSIKTIVTQIAAQLNIAISNPSIIPNRNVNSGWAYIGKAKDALTEALGFVDLIYTFQNREIIIYREGTQASSELVELASDSGLIGSPEQIDDVQTNETPDGKGRIKVTALALYNFTAGNLVQVSSISYKGIYTIESVRFNLDNFQGKFEAVMELAG